MDRSFKSQTLILYIKSVKATKISNCGANYRDGQHNGGQSETVTDTKG